MNLANVLLSETRPPPKAASCAIASLGKGRSREREGTHGPRGLGRERVSEGSWGRASLLEGDEPFLETAVMIVPYCQAAEGHQRLHLVAVSRGLCVCGIHRK